MNRFISIYLFCVITLMFSNVSYSQWVQIQTPIGSDFEINDFVFNDVNSGTLLTSENKGIYQTNDGGTNWSLASSYFDVDSIGDFIGEYINYFSDLSAYVVLNSSKGYFLYETKDGGETWFKKDSIGDFNDVHQIEFINEQYGIIGREESILYTKDSCKTWSEIEFDQPLEGFLIIDTTEFLFSYKYPSWTNGETFRCKEFGDIRTNETYFPFTYGMTSFKDGIASSARYYSIYLSEDTCKTWNRVDGSREKDAIYSVLQDTLIGCDQGYIYLSYDNGVNWHKQPSSKKDSGSDDFNNFFEKNGEVYASKNNLLLKINNLGDDDSPSIKFAPYQRTNVCNDSIINFKYTGGEYDSLIWKDKLGNVLSQNEELNDTAESSYTLPDLITFWLSVYNDGYVDSAQCNYRAAYYYEAPEFTSILSPIKDCDTRKDLITLYPYNDKYDYFLNDSILLDESRIDGDTAYFLTDVNFHNENFVSGSLIGDICKTSPRTSALLKSIKPYHFNDSDVIFDKEVYCLYDTVYIKISSSQNGANYSLLTDNNIEIESVIGTGDTLFFSYRYDEFSRENLKLEYESSTCSGEVEINISYERSNFYWSTDKYYYAPTDSILISFLPLATDSLMTLNVYSDNNEFSYSNELNDHYLKLDVKGIYKLQYDILTKHLCKNESIVRYVQVSDSLKGYQGDLCQLDIDSINGYYTTLSVFQDSTGRYVAGFDDERNIRDNIYTAPGQSFRRFDSDGTLLWEHNLTRNSLRTEYYLSSFGRDIIDGDSGFVYITGQMQAGSFQLEDYVFHNSEYEATLYMYLAKLNKTTGEIIWVTYFEGSTYREFKNDYGFSDVVYLDGRIYILSDRGIGSVNKLYFCPDNTTNQIVDYESKGRYSLLTFDTSGKLVENEDLGESISSNIYTYSYRGSSYGIGYSIFGYLNVNKQNNIDVRLRCTNYRPNSLNEVNVWGSDFSLREPKGDRSRLFFETHFNYKPGIGVTNSFLTVESNAYFSSLSNNNTVVFDSYGNSYYYHNVAEYLNWYDDRRSRYYSEFAGDVLPNSSGILSKIDADGNLLWYRIIQDVTIRDIEISNDEKHIGLSVYKTYSTVENAKKYSVQSSENEHKSVSYKINKGIYVQYSNVGDLEYHLRVGPDKTNSEYILKDENGYFNLALTSNITSAKDSIYIHDGDTLSFPESISKYYDWIARIDDFNGGCPLYANTDPIGDTLFLKEQTAFSKCSFDNVYLEWIATDGISTVDISYKKGSESTEYVIAKDYPANEYGILCNLDSLLGTDSLFFSIKSSDESFFDEELFTVFPVEIDTVESVSICENDVLIIDGELVTKEGYYKTSLDDETQCGKIEMQYVEIIKSPINKVKVEDDTLCAQNVSYDLPLITPLGGAFSGDVIVEDEKFVISDTMQGEYFFVYTLQDDDGCIWYDSTFLYVDVCTSINSFIYNDEVKIMPNPIFDVLNITFSSNEKDYVLKIMNLNGEVIIAKEVHGNSSTQVNTKKLINGFYVLAIYDQDEMIFREKVVKTN